MNSVSDAPKSLEEMLAETAALLHQAQVQLAIAEAGTDGAIARRLKATPESSKVLTKERAWDSAAELATALRVSNAKVEAFGVISAMVAAEAAVELIDTYEGGWGLVVMLPQGNPQAGLDVTSLGGVTEPGFIALGTPGATVIKHCSREQFMKTTFEILREHALIRLKQH